MRIKALGQSVLETALVVALGFVGIFLLNVITWGFEQTPGSTFNTVLQTTSRIWLNAHFVPIHIQAGKVADIKVPAYDFTLVPLGFSLLICWAIYRAGRRLAGQEHLGFAWLGAISSYLLLSVGLTSAAYSKAIFVTDLEGVFIPSALFAAILIFASLTGEVETEGSLRIRTREFFSNRFEKLPWAIKPLISPALRAGTAITAGLAAVSALVISVLLIVNWVEAIRLYQSLQLSFFGTVTLSAGQLALIPNAIIYGMSWLTGVGFTIGQGSMVSPLAVELGPLPPIPLLSALPVTGNSFLIVFVLVPILFAFAATLLIKEHTAELRFNYASATSAALALGIGIGLVSALEMALLADLSGGGIGPGRLTEVGVNPLLVFGLTFVEVSVASILASFFSARPEGVDTELIQKVRRLK